MSPTVFWVKLDGLDFREGAPVKKLVTAGNDLALDVTDRFRQMEMFTFLPATESTLGGP
jgi:choloylglycine hydrolase